MKQFFKEMFSGPFQLILVISFSVVAALSIAIGTWAISRTITDYLAEAMNERVARDMQLAQAFYNLTLREIEGITLRLSADAVVVENITPLSGGEKPPRDILDGQLANSLSGLALGGNHLIAILDAQGTLLAGRLLSEGGNQTKIEPSGNWQNLGIIHEAISTGKHQAATEIIPVELLAQVGLAEQAQIAVLETPKAAAQLFDPREGSAGLVLISVSPVNNNAGVVTGVVLAFHLFNQDFTLVDRIKEVAGIDTATIFLGDLRVSTNVMTLEGERAIGTRVSEEVSKVVLEGGSEFVGPAFVVNENYITRYDPLKNYMGNEIGILYVGAKQASYNRLVNTFNQRILLVSIGTILLVFFLTAPVSRQITRPLNQLKELVAANRQVAQGDLTVRVPVRAGGEIGLLTTSFNHMLDTLQATQDQLVQSEKLASLGQLAAGVAHELNNPLGTILLYSDILSKETGPDSPMKNDLEMIVNETKRCKVIVGALLEFARQNQVNAQPTDLNALIESVLDVEQKRIADVPVEIVRQLDVSLPSIQADHGQLTQVLVNLVENAVDAMPQGGKVTVRTRNQPEGMVTIEIEDLGGGIPPENLGKLFVPFFTTKPLGKGTGLGLAITYGIIKMHRGQINVRSEVGKGTTFIIQLPVKLVGLTRNNTGTVNTVR